MTEHTCIQEPTITQLQVHQDYETQRIDELRDKIDKMDKKLDKVLEGFNELKLQSNKDDNQLELRLKAIETELELQKQVATENHNRVSQLLALVGVGLTIITILINMDETKNWKVITTDEAGEPILKYDPHRDETVNVITGEVVQGH